MLSFQSTTLTTLVRVQNFLDVNATLVASVITPTLRGELDSSVAQLTAAAVEQDTTTATSKGETYNQGVLRQQIRSRYMRPIVQIAAMQLRSVAEYPALTMPMSRVPMGVFIVAAQSMINAANNNATTLINAGLTTDLVPSFTTALSALSASVENRGRSRARRAASTAGLVDQTKTGRGLIVVIDALIEPVLAGNVEITAEWRSASRIPANPGRPAGKTPVSPTPLPPVTPTPAGGAVPAGVHHLAEPAPAAGAHANTEVAPAVA